MPTGADAHTADPTGTSDDRATPARLRRLPSRLLTQTAMPTDRRRNVVTITPGGRRHLRRLDQLVATASTTPPDDQPA